MANAAGDVHDFNNTTDYIWTIARTTAGISGFDAAAFNLDTASFSNALGSGLFLIETANGGNDIVLRFVSRPAITLQPVGGSAECTSNFTFAVTATGSAPLSYQWKHAGTNLPVASSAMLTVAASAGTAGNYSVEVSNAYGTTNSDSAALVVVDTTPPTITCPSNQVASVPPGQTNAVVNYPSPEATDSCSSVTTACVPASGSTFAGGTTTVTCTATDGSSNVATCTFTVTVSIGLAAGNDTIGAVANHSASVSAAKLLANDSSGGGNTLSISAVSSSSTNGGTVALSAGVVTYTPVAIFTGTDAFTYTLEDNQGGTATGTVIVLVRPANNASLNQISATTTQNGVLVRFAGIPGRTYNIERSLDSITWGLLGSATAQPNGVIGFEDTNPPAGPAFYRTVVP